MDIEDKIIEYIKVNRVSSVEVADCLGKAGVFKNAKPTQRGVFKVGKIRWVYAWKESNWTIHDQIRFVKPNDVVMIEAFECKDRAIIGSLVSKFLLLYKQVAAIVSNAPFRDANDIYKEQYAVWCNGFTPVGCFNIMPEDEPDEDLLRKHKENYDGAIAVCDDNGVVIIPKEQHTNDFLDKLKFIEEQEDIWFDCLDRKKWDTFEIVCEKKYLKER